MWRIFVLTMKSTVSKRPNVLHKDKETLDAFFKENVVPNTKTFDSITDKIQYLLERNYIEELLSKYRPEF